MIVEIEESGGFTGIPRSFKIDTDNLPKDQAKKISEIIKNLKLDNTLQYGIRKPGAADYFNYSVTVNEKGITKTRQYDQSTAPQEIKELIKSISEIYANKKK